MEIYSLLRLPSHSKREQSDEHRKLRDCVQRVVIARELKAKAIVVRRFARRLRPDMKCAAEQSLREAQTENKINNKIEQVCS